MKGGKAKKMAPPVAAVVGLALDKPKDFYKSVSSAIKTALELPFATHQEVQRGTREVVYIKEPNSGFVAGEGSLLPALQLYSDAKQSAWLVVEIECEGSNPTMLLQVSLKLLQGVTTEAARLCFRAEWDVRNDTSDHAQPHWNIHPPGDEVRDDPGEDENFAAFEEREAAGATDTFAKFLRAMVTDRHLPETDDSKEGNADPREYGFSRAQMHRFHFAMAVNWHGRPGTGTHTPKLTNSEELVRWIVACIQYIKQQFAFMMSLQ